MLHFSIHFHFISSAGPCVRQWRIPRRGEFSLALNWSNTPTTQIHFTSKITNLPSPWDLIPVSDTSIFLCPPDRSSPKPPLTLVLLLSSLPALVSHGVTFSPGVSLAEPGTTAQWPRLPHSVWGGGADVYDGGLRCCREALPQPRALLSWGT